MRELEQLAKQRKENFTREKYLTVKEGLKTLGKEIREWKNNRKEDKRKELSMKLSTIEDIVFSKKFEFRHKHIVYCLLRGQLYEEIERKTNKYTCKKKIKNYIEEFTKDE